MSRYTRPIWIAVIGVTISLGSLYVLNYLRSLEEGAGAFVGGMEFMSSRTECNDASLKDVRFSRYLISDTETATVTATILPEDDHCMLLANQPGKSPEDVKLKPCDSKVSLSSPRLESTPSAEQIVTISSCAGAVVHWVIAPKSVGVTDVIINLGWDYIARRIAVTDSFGFTAGQSKLLATLGVFLGSAATLPWLIELYQSQRTQQSRQEERYTVFLTFTKAIALLSWFVIIGATYYWSLDKNSTVGGLFPEAVYTWHIIDDEHQKLMTIALKRDPERTMRMFESEGFAIRMPSIFGFGACFLIAPLLYSVASIAQRLSPYKVVFVRKQ